MATADELDLNDIAAFVQVVEGGSFSKAARALGVPTSTVSRRVARLEDRLGTRLLHRTTRKVGLTEPGRLYYERCASAVQELNQADRAIHEMQEVPSGRLRVAAPHDMSGRISALLDRYLTAYPDVQVELSVSERFVDLVAEGFDVALRGGPRPETAALIARRVEITPRLLVATPGYLHRRGTPKVLDDLSAHDTLVFTPWGMAGSWTLRQHGKLRRVALKPRLSVNSLAMVLDAARSGHGIAQVLRSLVCEDISAGRLVQVLPDACFETSAAWIVYPSRRHVLPSVRAFVDLVLEEWTGKQP